jgi:tetratricopeptide (TPR) repeat protein
LGALQTGVPHFRWLLVFDNAIRPDVIQRYLPAGGSVHVLITTQSHGWRRVMPEGVLDVLEFEQAETVEFLRRRVPRLAPVIAPAVGPAPDDRPAHGVRERDEEQRRKAEATLLAAVLEGVPLAAEQAAAFLNETEVSVDAYLDRFGHVTESDFSTDAGFLYPNAVATCCAVAQEALSPSALALLRVLAMLSSEPVSVEILVQPTVLDRLPEELHVPLSGVRPFRDAVRELARFSLVKFDGVRNETQIHRLVKAIVERGLRQEGPRTEERFRGAVHVLLAETDPRAPERDENDAAYERSRAHLVPSGAVTSDHPPVRELVINQVRHLQVRARYSEAHDLARSALNRWRRILGEDHLQTLALATDLGIVLRRLGRNQEALDLNAGTLHRLRLSYGIENEVFLTCARSYSTDLRALGQYADALAWDQDWLALYVQEFGTDHIATLKLLNNIAIGLRCVGRYEEALKLDQRTYEAKLDALGKEDLQTLNSRFAKARDLRRLGRYEDSLDELIEINRLVERRGEEPRLPTLLYALDLGVALRRTGDRQEALNRLEPVLGRHHALVGTRHRQSLSVATNLINDRRLAGDLDGARRLGRLTVDTWAEVAGADHPNTLAAIANLAIVHRLQGRPDQARHDDARVLARLTELFDAEHPYCLAVTANLAADHAALGDTGEAVRLGERALDGSRMRRGSEHPFTLATAANLALDLEADGAEDRARDLRERTLAGYRRTLAAHHPETRAVSGRRRVDLDIEPDHV